MEPLDYFLNNIEQVYRDERTGQEFSSYESMRQHCVVQANNMDVGVVQESLEMM